VLIAIRGHRSLNRTEFCLWSQLFDR